MKEAQTGNPHKLPFINSHLCTDRPRVAFLGTGWIGGQRLKAIAERGAVEIAGLAVLCQKPLALQQDLDALVIATPTAIMDAPCCTGACPRCSTASARRCGAPTW